MVGGKTLEYQYINNVTSLYINQLKKEPTSDFDTLLPQLANYN